MKAQDLVEDRGDVSRALFDRIAPRYDLTNRVLSFGQDERWRRRLVKALPARAGLRVLDVATGTGDLAFAMSRDPRVDEVVGVDLSEQMLAVARDKAPDNARITFATGDAMDLGYTAAFDAVTIAFGIRNVSSPIVALRSMKQALRPAGRVLVLEFGEVYAPVRPLYNLYRRHILPVVGGALTREREAYRYLDETIAQFPSGEAFAEKLTEAGFVDPRVVDLALGGVRLYVGDVA